MPPVLGLGKQALWRICDLNRCLEPLGFGAREDLV